MKNMAYKNPDDDDMISDDALNNCMREKRERTKMRGWGCTIDDMSIYASRRRENDIITFIVVVLTDVLLIASGALLAVAYIYGW